MRRCSTSSGRSPASTRSCGVPRSSATAKLTPYGLAESPDALLLLDRLGRHKRSVACVHIPRLEDVDDAVLRDLVALAWATNGTGGASDATC